MQMRPEYFSVVLALLLSMRLGAEEGFYVGAIRDLAFQGEAPSADDLGRIHQQRMGNRDAVYVESGEALLFQARYFRQEKNHANPWSEQYDGLTLAVRGESGATIKGALLIPDGKGSGKRHEFKVMLAPGSDNHRKAFWTPWRAHNTRMINEDHPGGAWFRHQIRRAEEALAIKSAADRRRRFFGSRSVVASSAESTFALISGGRVVSERLHLDRDIPIRGAAAETVALSSISGIMVREFDWIGLNKGLSPAPDPLAALIPADQHAVFLPSFQSMVALADNAYEHGTPLLQLTEPRAEDAQVRARYERQLCLSLNSVARVIGPQLIDSLAMTGGDTYLRTGSDVALLMESKQPQALLNFIEAQMTLVSGGTSAARIQGDIKGVAYSGYRSPAREISSWRCSSPGCGRSSSKSGPG